VIMLTALGEEPEVIHGLEQGADDYIVKPFKLEKLVEKLGFLAGLLESLHGRNAVTNLPGTDAIKREVNHRLARGRGTPRRPPPNRRPSAMRRFAIGFRTSAASPCIWTGAAIRA